ncbi:YitT family protein [Alkaliflexus imshenetskii]|uniref:YitT family protein n=1 Tax=Alkaliflexus imshenetskii TaxID=286730 RepID=UPI00047A2B5A|nr:YitT family protein [Alkaliflexus imshenetskii]
MNLTDLRKNLQSWFFLTLGIAISATGWAGFIIPSKIIGGGVAGISTVLHYAMGFNIGLTLLLLNAVLILLAMKIVGASFGVKTIYGVAVFSLFLSIISHYTTEPPIAEKFMATLTGSILAGIGGSMVFIHGGSTGGTDIIAMMISKYRNISLGRLLLYIDTVIISSSFLLFRSIETMVYGLITMAILAYTVDTVMSGTKQTVQFFIFSKKHEELSHHIINVARRGLTVLPGKGGFSGEDVTVLMVIAKKNESPAILRLIKQVDPDAFITMGSVMGVYGKGFDAIKA